jgi:hypothetical protein
MLELSSIWGKATVVAKLLISSGRNRHATPFCISEYLRNRPRAGGTTSQGAKLVGCHVKIASSGTKRKSNPTGGAEGSEISGLPKAGERTKTQRFKKKGVLEGLHQKIGGLYRAVALQISAFGGEADMTVCGKSLSRSRLGGKADIAFCGAYVRF